MRQAGFLPSRETKVIIHGFIDTGLEAWVRELASVLLEAEDVNVITVDWGGGSLPLYSQAAANTRLVGLEVAALLQRLAARHGLNLATCHIIGHR